MTNDTEHLRALGRAKLRLSAALTTAMVIAYFGFMTLVAYAKEWLGVQIVPGLSWGILLGAGIIFFAWFLTFIYVQWTNRVYDAGIERIRGGSK